MKDRWITKDTLIKRIQSADDGDKSAWEEFVTYYKSFIEALLAKSSFSLNEKDDLIQEILIRIWKGIPSFEYRKGEVKFRSWLSRVIKNTMYNYIDKLNRKKTDKLELNEAIYIPDQVSNLETYIEDEWSNHLIKLAMKSTAEVFSGKAMEVFELSLKGVEISEIAKKLDLAETSVYSLRRRVKIRLKKEIELLQNELEQ
ncbi:MAG: RNA polymerase sigma factor [Lentisphaeraceae bacterium]|nr:RNA polymerase sigma factor [Lentisphaeraceae bacterium]